MTNYKNSIYYIAAVVVVLAMVGAALLFLHYREAKRMSFVYSPSQEGTLQEAGSIKNSSSSDWWLNSGGIMDITPGGFSTNLGNLPADNKWRVLYNKTNPTDTDNGFHPQNIFRLVTQKQWQNLEQQVYFNIENINLSESENRYDPNGVLLFNRYMDGSNLYYAGVRVDGDAVIKKKIDGRYYTMKEAPVFTNGQKYDRDKNPNLIPLNQWIGIRTVVTNTDSDTVDIKLYIDRQQTGDWQLLLETKDSDGDYGKAPFMAAGHAGIRTDFMDVKFKNYSIQEN